MHTHAVFLRGMNLGKRRIKNPELVEAVMSTGVKSASAFLASGNLAIEGSGQPAHIAKALSEGLFHALGYPVDVFVRSAKRVRELAQCVPFEERAGAEQRGKLQVAFFGSEKAAKYAEAFGTDDDWLAAYGSELFWLPRAGLSDSTLDLKAIMKAHGSCTVRTHRTISRMAGKYF